MSKKVIATLVGASAVIGVAGLSMIKEHEGLRTSAYRDPIGIPTICYGHTGPEVRIGLKYTVEKCEEVLLDDIRKHRAGLEKCIKHPLNTNQWDAVTSFAFNVGVSRACGSTMVKKINAGDLKGASAEFPKWRFAGGREFPGLVRRRAHERALFDSKQPPAVYAVVRYAHLAE